MNKQSRKIIAPGMVLAMLLSGIVAADPMSQDVVDARQESQIWTTYALSPYLRASDLNVAVHSGKATLTGKVDENVNKELAKQIALGVKGITEVDNQIVVQNDYAPVASTTDRSYGTIIDDATITAAVKSKLAWNKNTDGLTTDVDTSWGNVTLKGTADSGASKDLAGRLAMNTRGVVSVNNQLVVNTTKPTVAEAAKTSADKAAQKFDDSWITTKVKSTFLYSSNVAGSNITVSTKNGVVTLGGKVNSGAERALAIELAKDVRGVQSVNANGLTHS